MIPKYFRCGDASLKCPLSLSRETVKEDKKWVCPCANPNCVDTREPVSFGNGFTRGRVWLFYTAASLLVLIFLSFLFFKKNDHCLEKLETFQFRKAALDRELALSEPKSDEKNSLSLSISEIAELKGRIDRVEVQAGKALVDKNETDIEKIKKEIDELKKTISHLKETSYKPDVGSGIYVAEAGRIAGELQKLEDEVEQQVDLVEAEGPEHVALFENFLPEVRSALSKARNISASPGNTTLPKQENKKSLDAEKLKLDSVENKLNSFVAMVPLPFPSLDADLRIVGSPEIAAQLLKPLVSAWCESETVTDAQGAFYVKGGDKGKILIQASTNEEGFEQVAEDKVSIFFADRAPSDSELKRFGDDFKESRSVAEVVALDALTFLVHPDCAVDTFEVGNSTGLKMTTGPKGFAEQQIAARFGFGGAQSMEVSGEQLVLTDKNILALGLYHNEAQNLRAKRLAIKASPEALALKPSPFTVATEDYLYTYRIVAWTPPKPNNRALEFIKFVTSNSGQAIVEKSGYVDLRLRSMETVPDPLIQTALAGAIGSKTISSAIRISTNFRFDTGEAKLDLKAQADVERLPRYIAANFPKYQLVILGFTDNVGNQEFNKELSVKRANVVLEKLARELNSSMATHIAGLGPYLPVASNDTDEGKRQNRRAEVWVVKP